MVGRTAAEAGAEQRLEVTRWLMRAALAGNANELRQAIGQAEKLGLTNEAAMAKAKLDKLQPPAQSSDSSPEGAVAAWLEKRGKTRFAAAVCTLFSQTDESPTEWVDTLERMEQSGLVDGLLNALESDGQVKPEPEQKVMKPAAHPHDQVSRPVKSQQNPRKTKPGHPRQKSRQEMRGQPSGTGANMNEVGKRVYAPNDVRSKGNQPDNRRKPRDSKGKQPERVHKDEVTVERNSSTTAETLRIETQINQKVQQRQPAHRVASGSKERRGAEGSKASSKNAADNHRNRPQQPTSKPAAGVELQRPVVASPRAPSKSPRAKSQGRAKTAPSAPQAARQSSEKILNPSGTSATNQRDQNGARAYAPNDVRNTINISRPEQRQQSHTVASTPRSTSPTPSDRAHIRQSTCSKLPRAKSNGRAKKAPLTSQSAHKSAETTSTPSALSAPRVAPKTGETNSNPSGASATTQLSQQGQRAYAPNDVRNTSKRASAYAANDVRNTASTSRPEHRQRGASERGRKADQTDSSQQRATGTRCGSNMDRQYSDAKTHGTGQRMVASPHTGSSKPRSTSPKSSGRPSGRRAKSTPRQRRQQREANGTSSVGRETKIQVSTNGSSRPGVTGESQAWAVGNGSSSAAGHEQRLEATQMMRTAALSGDKVSLKAAIAWAEASPIKPSLEADLAMARMKLQKMG